MKIAYLTAGAAGMYCGSCLHDNTLAAALLARGEDVTLTPIYTPIRTDETDVSDRRVFYGGINVYLQQLSGLFRGTPRWLDSLLDHPALLRLASRGGGSVDPAKLGGLTVSMLQGEDGNQRKEVDRLVDWIVGPDRPDVVHLSNSMMIGVARRIAQRGGPPVVCSLSGEDIFLEKLTAPHYEEARGLLRDRAQDIDAFVALNGYYADFMADYLAVDRTKIEVIPHGLLLDGHATGPNRPSGPTRRIGYLARVCHDKGLHLLAEAGELLANRDDLPPFEIEAAGYLGAGDRGYLAEIERKAAAGSLAGRFRYVGELDRRQKIDFLQSLHLMALPTVYRESKGLPVLESLANSTPVVVPEHGSFPEIVADTGGGVLFEPHNSAQLAEAIAGLLTDEPRAAELGEQGRRSVHQDYHADRMAERTLQLYQRVAADRLQGNPVRV